MDTKNHADKNIQKTLNKYYYIIVVLGLTLSAVAFILSFVVENTTMTGIFQIIGSLMAGALISGLLQVKLLGDFNKQDIKLALQPDLHNLENVLEEQIQNIVPVITGKTISSVKNIEDRVSKATDFMLNGIGVLSGANQSGIVNIFPNRYSTISNTSVIQEISKEMREEKNSISIMGISLGDFFLDRGQLNKVFMEVIEKERTIECPLSIIRAMIVNPHCNVLRERARWEVGHEYYYDPIFYDSTTFIETDGAARIAKRLFENKKNIEVKTYKLAPTAFVLMTSRFLFLEPYSYASRGGGKVPVFQVKAGSDLYKHYESHFNRVWNNSAETISNYQALPK